MTLRRKLVIGVIATVLSLQFVIPSVQYFSDGANRWGWQMYSRVSLQPEIIAVTADGDRREVDLSRYVFHMRSELRVDAEMLDQLCAMLPDANSFELIHHEDATETEMFQCSG